MLEAVSTLPVYVLVALRYVTLSDPFVRSYLTSIIYVTLSFTLHANISLDFHYVTSTVWCSIIGVTVVQSRTREESEDLAISNNTHERYRVFEMFLLKRMEYVGAILYPARGNGLYHLPIRQEKHFPFYYQEESLLFLADEVRCPGGKIAINRATLIITRKCDNRRSLSDLPLDRYSHIIELQVARTTWNVSLRYVAVARSSNLSWKRRVTLLAPKIPSLP